MNTILELKAIKLEKKLLKKQNKASKKRHNPSFYMDMSKLSNIEATLLKEGNNG